MTWSEAHITTDPDAKAYMAAKALYADWQLPEQNHNRSLLWIRFIAVAFQFKEENFWRRGPPPLPPPSLTYFASPWIRPWADMAKTS